MHKCTVTVEEFASVCLGSILEKQRRVLSHPMSYIHMHGFRHTPPMVDYEQRVNDHGSMHLEAGWIW